MAISFTKEQQAVIDSRGHNILVSASAGSGKTTVMIQRIIDLVLDEKHPTPISNFLVVTFTKASASDMKKKLIDAFLKHQDDPFILEQIDDVETSDISNLHSFCSKLISTYFYEVGIDPSFQVLDETNSRYLKEKAFEKLFDIKEKMGDVAYLRLFDIFQKNRNNSALKEIIAKFNDFMNANLDAQIWMEKTFDDIYNEDLNKNSCAKLINHYVSLKIQEIIEIVENTAKLCLDNGLEKIYEFFIDVVSMLATVNIKNSYELNAKNLFDINIPKAPTVKSNVVIKPIIEETKKMIKDSILNFRKNFISADTEFLKQGLCGAKETLMQLFKLVQEFNVIYDEIKKDCNGLDFNDLEKYALKVLNNPQIIQTVKNRYRYIFVDEYQDINSVQEKIISLIASEDNRFMVGDVKQSIYRFRYCDPEIFLQKYAEYGLSSNGSELHKLNCNFRSDKKILKFVDEVFMDVMTEKFGGIDYKKDAMFVAGENNLDNPNSVNLCFIDTTTSKPELAELQGVYSVKNHVQPVIEDEEIAVAEARYVVDKIAQLIEEKGRDFEYGHVAVLIGSRNEMVEKFIESLKSMGIPVACDEKYDLMKRPYIQEIICFVKYVNNTRDDYLLFKVLKSRMFNFCDEELSKIRELNMQGRFFECIDDLENIQDVNLKSKLVEFINIRDRFCKFAKLLSIKDLCRKIIADFELDKINNASMSGERALFEMCKLIEVLPDTSVTDFCVNYENFSLELESECSDENSVSIMTIHKSKGIEFKYVFLINTSGEFNFRFSSENVIFNKDFGVGVDYFDTISRTQIESVASSGIKLLERRKLVEEKQRVLYVALTRAIERLYIVCSKPINKIGESQKERKTCFCDWFDWFIYNELNEKHNPIINFEHYNLSELCESSETQRRVLSFKEFDVQEREWFNYDFNPLVQIPLKNSITKIIRDKNIDKNIGYERGVSSAERGTVYHKCLQKINLTGNVDIILQIKHILKNLPDEERTLVDEDVLIGLLNLPIFEELKLAQKIFTEREFYAKVSTDLIAKGSVQDEFILQGVIDVLAVFEDGIIVMDYKTGKFNNANLETYKMQLNTYAEIAERSLKKSIKRKLICFIDEQKIIEI